MLLVACSLLLVACCLLLAAGCLLPAAYCLLLGSCRSATAAALTRAHPRALARLAPASVFALVPLARPNSARPGLGHLSCRPATGRRAPTADLLHDSATLVSPAPLRTTSGREAGRPLPARVRVCSAALTGCLSVLSLHSLLALLSLGRPAGRSPTNKARPSSPDNLLARRPARGALNKPRRNDMLLQLVNYLGSRTSNLEPRLDTTRHGSTRLGSTRLGSTGLKSTQLVARSLPPLKAVCV